MSLIGKLCRTSRQIQHAAGIFSGMLGSGFVFLVLALVKSRRARRQTLAARAKSREIQRRADEVRRYNNDNVDIDPSGRLREKGYLRD